MWCHSGTTEITLARLTYPTISFFVYCICEVPGSYDLRMVPCDKCQKWLHFKCIGSKEHRHCRPLVLCLLFCLPVITKHHTKHFFMWSHLVRDRVSLQQELESNWFLVARVTMIGSHPCLGSWYTLLTMAFAIHLYPCPYIPPMYYTITPYLAAHSTPPKSCHVSR